MRIMRIFGRLTFLITAMVCMASSSQAQWWNKVQHTSLLFGQKFLDDESFWEPLDEPFIAGFEYDARSLDSGLGWEFATLFTFDSEDDVGGTGIDADLFMVELDLGARYTADLNRFHPYIGGGVAVVYADISAEAGGLIASEDEVTVGGYAHVGGYFQLGDSFTLGLDVRGLFGTSVDFDTPIAGDVDYVQVALTIGWTN